MLFPPETIMALRPTGHPLHLTVETLDMVTCNLTAAGRGTFQISSGLLRPDPELTFHLAFAHYPDMVTINGEPVERTPFPDRASVRIVHSPTMDRSDTIVSLHKLDHLAAPRADLNTYACGILSDGIKPDTPSHPYWTKLPSEQPHWAPAAMVYITPVYVITDDELDSLGADAFAERNHQAIHNRANLQVEETSSHANIPPPSQETRFHHVTGAPIHLNQAKRLGAPMFINAPPAIFSGHSISAPALLSAAQALYRTDTGITPVVTASLNDSKVTPHVKIESFRFETTPKHGQPNAGSPITPVENITMHYRLDGEPADRTVEAPFVMYEEDDEQIKVEYVPNRTNRQELQESIIRAYRCYSDYTRKQFIEENLEELTAKVTDLMDGTTPF